MEEVMFALLRPVTFSLNRSKLLFIFWSFVVLLLFGPSILRAQTASFNTQSLLARPAEFLRKLGRARTVANSIQGLQSLLSKRTFCQCEPSEPLLVPLPVPVHSLVERVHHHYSDMKLSQLRSLLHKLADESSHESSDFDKFDSDLKMFKSAGRSPKHLNSNLGRHFRITSNGNSSPFSSSSSSVSSSSNSLLPNSPFLHSSLPKSSSAFSSPFSSPLYSTSASNAAQDSFRTTTGSPGSSQSESSYSEPLFAHHHRPEDFTFPNPLSSSSNSIDDDFPNLQNLRSTHSKTNFDTFNSFDVPSDPSEEIRTPFPNQFSSNSPKFDFDSTEESIGSPTHFNAQPVYRGDTPSTTAFSPSFRSPSIEVPATSTAYPFTNVIDSPVTSGPRKPYTASSPTDSASSSLASSSTLTSLSNNPNILSMINRPNRLFVRHLGKLRNQRVNHRICII
jgi:hypothetical protein